MSTARYEISRSDAAVSPELRYITHSRYDNEWLSIQHSHSIAEMLYILAGEGSIVTGSRQKRIEGGDFIIIPPHLMHTEISSSNSPLEYLCIGVSNVDVAESTDDFDPIVDLGTDKYTVVDLMVKIYREVQRRQSEYELMAKAYFYRMLVILVRSRIIAADRSEERAMRSNIADVKRYIDEHYSDNITLDFLSSLAALSKYYLIRQFKKALGASPMDYLLGQRITVAKNLLVDTELAMSDIAESVGFSSASYFSQRFRSVTGMSPIEFRQNSHGGLA